MTLKENAVLLRNKSGSHNIKMLCKKKKMVRITDTSTQKKKEIITPNVFEVDQFANEYLDYTEIRK